MFIDRTSIQTKFFRNMIVIAFSSIILCSLIWIQGEYAAFKAEADGMHAEHFQTQKQKLQEEVSNVVNYIEKLRTESEQQLGKMLEERVYEAHGIAMSIYRENANLKKLPEIEKMVKDALRPIRFFDGRGYYFAVSMSGIEQLYPSNPEIEGKDVTGMQDSNRAFVIQDEISVVRTTNEGFVKHYWAKPDKAVSGHYPKLSFVKYFKPFDWYFGAGEYLDEFEKQIQKEILNRIVNLRFGAEGYFFGSTFDGAPLFSNGKLTIGTDNVWEMTDPSGVKIIQEQSQMAQNSDGGFVNYSWQKLSSVQLSPKISYVKGIPDWKWTIGAGAYIDTLEEAIAQKKKTLTDGLRVRVVRSGLIIAVLLCLIVFWSKRIATQMQKSVDTFSSFLKKASSDLLPINPDEIKLKEFRDVAILINEMLTERKHIENRLRKSDQKWQFALEGAGDGVWDWDAPTNKVYYSTRWKSMLGFSDDDIGGTLAEWDSRIHPDDRDAAYTALEKHFKREVPEYQNEHRLRCKDGSYKWILDRGKVIEWTDDGKPARVIGTHSDIAERKKYEAEREELIERLRDALACVKTLTGLLPICSHCKKIRDDSGYWNNVEIYVEKHSNASLTHSICQECAKKYYPDYDIFGEIDND